MSSVITATRPADKNCFNVRDGANIHGLEADTVTTWDDLTDDEREFLTAWRQADAVRQGVALEILLNSQLHGERDNIIKFEDARKKKLE